MSGRKGQNKSNLDKIKREMTAKKKKAQKQEIIATDVRNEERITSGDCSFVQAQDRPIESVTENNNKDNSGLIAATEAEKAVNQEQQVISDEIVDTRKIKLVVFRVADEEYALKVSYVNEIIRIPSITELPNLPDYIIGLCSLRGSLMPVIDCRILLGIAKQDYNENSRIIVTDIYGKKVGLISDKVLEVIDVDEAAVKEPPASFKGINGGALNGIVILNNGKRVIMILAAEKMIKVDKIDEAIKQQSTALGNLAYSEAHEDEEEQIVIFSVGSGEYAFSINYVKEIIRLPELVKVPNTASYVEGMFSIRNELLAVINMGKFLGTNCEQPDEQSRVIIINNSNYSYGVIVDKVSNVIHINRKLFKENMQKSELIKGIYSLNNGHRLIMMPDPQKLISLDEVLSILNNKQKKIEKDVTLSIGEADNVNEYVVFKLGEEEYGVRIQNVKEVNRITEITHFPGAPDFISGMVDLRGEIMPILNLRKRFDLQELSAYNESKFIVIEHGNKKIGILVDLVTGVMRFSGDNLEAYPESLKGSDNNSYIDKIAKLNDGKRIIILLNLSTLLSFM